MALTPQLKKEIYTYDAPWNTYTLAWSNHRDLSKSFRLAVGSFKLEYSNVVNVSAHISKSQSCRNILHLWLCVFSYCSLIQSRKSLTFSPPSSIHTQLHTCFGNLTKRVVPRTCLLPRAIIYDYGKSLMTTENRSVHLKWDSIMCVKNTICETTCFFPVCIELLFFFVLLLIVLVSCVLLGFSFGNAWNASFFSFFQIKISTWNFVLFIVVLHRFVCFIAHRNDRNSNHGLE